MGRNKLKALVHRLTFRDWWMLVNMFFFIWIGGMTLYRSFSRNASWLAFFIGAGFLMMGGCRFYLFWKAAADIEVREQEKSEGSER